MPCEITKNALPIRLSKGCVKLQRTHCLSVRVVSLYQMCRIVVYLHVDFPSIRAILQVCQVLWKSLWILNGFFCMNPDHGHHTVYNGTDWCQWCCRVWQPDSGPVDGESTRLAEPGLPAWAGWRWVNVVVVFDVVPGCLAWWYWWIWLGIELFRNFGASSSCDGQ